MPSTAQVIRHDRPFTFFGAGLLGVAAVAFTGFLAEAKVTPAAALTSAGQNRIAVITRTVSDAESMVRAFDEVGYTLDEVREGGQVPRILVTRLPGDLASIEKVDRRKAAFKQAVLPLILIANERIVAQRRELLNLRDIRAAGFPLADTQRAWLAALAEDYGVADRDIDKLLLKVDIVPPSLALAQSIEESGWGTSYFARTGNALFGQRGWGADTPGMTPAIQKAGETFKVRAFPWMLDGVQAYVHNLNTHPAYAELRRLRAEAREKGTLPSGYELAGALLRYSERGVDYVTTIRYLMRENELAVFDRVRLNPPELVTLLDHVKPTQPTS